MRTKSFFSCLMLLSLVALGIATSSCGKQDGAFSFKNYSYSQHVRAADKADEYMDIEFDIDFPNEYEDAQVLAAFQDELMNRIFPKHLSAEPIKQAMRIYADTLAADYRLDNAAFYPEDLYETEIPLYFPAELSIRGEVIAETEDVISYQIQTYYYYGGAHGSTATEYVPFNKKKGWVMTLADVYSSDEQAELPQLMVEALLVQHQATKEDLEARGFDLQAVVPSDNFFVDGDRIVFHFDAYDIAPYCEGAQDIELPL